MQKINNLSVLIFSYDLHDKHLFYMIFYMIFLYDAFFINHLL